MIVYVMVFVMSMNGEFSPPHLHDKVCCNAGVVEGHGCEVPNRLS
jgi:hypothetical protein